MSEQERVYVDPDDPVVVYSTGVWDRTLKQEERPLVQIAFEDEAKRIALMDWFACAVLYQEIKRIGYPQNFTQNDADNCYESASLMMKAHDRAIKDGLHK